MRGPGPTAGRTTMPLPGARTGPRTAMPPSGARTGPPLPHSTRPAPAASVPGTHTGATSDPTGHPVEPNASAPGGALGPAHSLALTGSGTDRLRGRPGEAGTAARVPQLVLTFGAE